MPVVVGIIGKLVCTTVVNAATRKKRARCDNEKEYQNEPFFHWLQR